jgi:mannose-6-phosphate isomerase-like protein (cupin superfamily)
MKIIRSDHLKFIPASHEDKLHPGVLKKVLFKKGELIAGNIQMINWARLPQGKIFNAHYHQDMEEIFIIITGAVEISIENEFDQLNPGDAVAIPIGSVHTMRNISKSDVTYIVIGISKSGKGKTINV